MLVLLTQIEILVHSSHASDLGKVCPQYFHTYHTVPTGKLLTFILNLTYAELYYFYFEEILFWNAQMEIKMKIHTIY